MSIRFVLTLLLACMMSVFAVDKALAGIDPGMIVGMWLFDEGEGDIVGDSSGNGHDGVITGPPQWTVGQFGDALDTSTISFVTVPHSEDLSLTTFTITVWLSMDGGAGWIGVVSKANQEIDRNYTLFLYDGTGAASISIGDEAGNTWNDGTGTTRVNDGTWHHVAISFDDETNTGRVFTDGVEEAEYTDETEVPQNEADLMFNSWFHGGVFGGYIGLLDEIAIFNVALEEADIKEIMGNGLDTFFALVKPEDKLTVRWGAIKSIDF